jgi:hypothetical protein
MPVANRMLAFVSLCHLALASPPKESPWVTLMPYFRNYEQLTWTDSEVITLAGSLNIELSVIFEKYDVIATEAIAYCKTHPRADDTAVIAARIRTELSTLDKFKLFLERLPLKLASHRNEAMKAIPRITAVISKYMSKMIELENKLEKSKMWILWTCLIALLVLLLAVGAYLGC